MPYSMGPYPAPPGTQQSGPWAPQRYPGQWGPPPKKGLSATTTIILALVLMLIVATIIGVLVFNFTDISGTTTTTTTHSTYTPPSPTPKPTPTPTSQEYTPGPPDLNPPDLPAPLTRTEAIAAVESNALYNQKLKSTKCTVTNIDLKNAPAEEISTHMNQFIDCLMTAWYPPVTGAGYTLPHPSVTVYSADITTPCGKQGTGNAFYCGADQQIYYATDLIDEFSPAMQPKRFLAETIMAHEFGHAVQFRTMIGMSELRLASQTDVESEQNQWSRRTELQADCFAGVFFNSVKTSVDLTSQDEGNIAEFLRSLGAPYPMDEDDHGTGEHRAIWVTKGLASSTPGTCNTYTASADEVS